MGLTLMGMLRRCPKARGQGCLGRVETWGVVYRGRQTLAALAGMYGSPAV